MSSWCVVVRRYIDFLILLIPTPLVSALFLQQHPYFLFFLFLFFNTSASGHELSVRVHLRTCIIV